MTKKWENNSKMVRFIAIAQGCQRQHVEEYDDYGMVMAKGMKMKRRKEGNFHLTNNYVMCFFHRHLCPFVQS